MKRALLFLAAFALLAAPLVACPNCKDASAGTAPGKGYFFSILTMLSMMGLVLAGMIRLIVKAGQGVADLPPESPGPPAP